MAKRRSAGSILIRYGLTVRRGRRTGRSSASRCRVAIWTQQEREALARALQRLRIHTTAQQTHGLAAPAGVSANEQTDL
ncbi:MAG: hypothetical protein RMN52_05045 [Anaerolineae bacterium]|nr:hypothetical protein [Candidatus Roseilinea sp.]MDW8449350.1 hypothetical protein [Anaerolineae bacterium]